MECRTMINITVDQWGLEYVTVENNGHFTTTLKSVYDEQQAEQSTPNLAD
jgi:hypothetical protein